MKKKWQIKPFEECVESVKYTRKIQRKDFLHDGQFPIVSQEAEFINGYWDDKADVFKVKTPVIIFGDHTQVLKYVDFDFVLGADGVKILPPCEFLNSKFLFYQLQAANFASLGYARHYRILKELEIKYPPLPEQHRIVAILDKAFEAIATARANAERNLKNARELFESYLNEAFTQRGEGWVEKPLGEIADVIGGYSFKSGDFKNEGKYQVIRMGNVRPGIIRENESPVFIDKLDESVLKRALLLPNDVIITQTGTKKKRDYGFTVIIEMENYLLNQRISAIRFTKNYLPKFFLYFSWTNLFKDQYFANETGTVGQGNVGIGAITSAVVPFLSLNDQQTIVQKLDVFSAETKKLQNIYQQKINDLDELKKSILHQAFSGEL